MDYYQRQQDSGITKQIQILLQENAELKQRNKELLDLLRKIVVKDTIISDFEYSKTTDIKGNNLICSKCNKRNFSKYKKQLKVNEPPIIFVECLECGHYIKYSFF